MIALDVQGRGGSGTRPDFASNVSVRSEGVPFRHMGSSIGSKGNGFPFWDGRTKPDRWDGKARSGTCTAMEGKTPARGPCLAAWNSPCTWEDRRPRCVPFILSRKKPSDTPGRWIHETLLEKKLSREGGPPPNEGSVVACAHVK